MGDQKDFYQTKFKYNISLPAQMRIHDILNQIANLDYTFPIDSPQKQKMYLNLVKQLFFSAIPYLSLADVKKYEEEILNFHITKKPIMKQGSQTLNYDFDPKLDKRLNQIIVELQLKLRRLFAEIRDMEDEGL